MSYEKKIAHILVDESSGEIKAEQTVLEHLKGTADLARKFGEAFGIPKIAEQCALYHDVGKYSDKFQKYIRGELNARVDHSTAGAKLLYNKGMWQLACAIAGHHAGLPDVGTPSDIADKSSFLGRMKRDDLLDCTSYLNELSDPEKCDFYDEEIKEINPRCSMDMTLLVRMIFSCLVDADFIDTEKFMRLGEVKRGNFAGVAELCDGLICKLKGNGFFNSKNVLNEKRTEILRRCMKMAEQRPGIFTLTVPTGGGKTLSSLAFALLHAKKYGKERIIYVIPYTSIIEQTADIFRSYLGDINVIEHHSDVSYDSESDSDESVKQKKLATENWDAPVIVTTNVQFFESLFACRTSKCRKLHNIANSVIVFDEAQMLPSDFLLPVLRTIESLTLSYRTTAILCSATQPHLEDFFKRDKVPTTEIMNGIDEMYQFFSRVTFVDDGEKSYDEIASALFEKKQVLCVALTKRAASDIFKGRNGEEGNFYLSTNLCPAHRRACIEEIKRRLNEGLECRVVSTTVISVGVDLDFPEAWVEQSGIDSMIQAAGRVNREGKRDASDSLVHIFSNPQKSRRFMRQETDATILVKQREDDISSPQAIDEYFKALYHAKGDSALDKKNIKDMSDRLAFREIAQNFKIIDENTKTVLIAMDGNAKEIIRELKWGKFTRELIREAAQYAVNVRCDGNNSDFFRLYGAGAVTPIDKKDDKLYVLNDMSLYDEVEGLKIPESGQSLFG